jgi:hypothetical protein
MKLLLFPILLLILVSTSPAQRQVLLASDASGWAFTRSLDGTNQQIDPTLADPDFWQTWLDQSFESYFSPLTYDGPAFQTNRQAPFFAGTVPGIQEGTSLDLPAGATWNNGYFMKVIDGGDLGYQNLGIKMLARDGAIIYLNGQVLMFSPNIVPRLYGDIEISSPGDGTTFLELPLHLFPAEKKILKPGPNLLAIAVARAPEETEDFGLKIEITGEPGIVPITPIVRNLTGNHLHLRWATSSPQKTLVKITNFTDGTTRIFESDAAHRNHYFTRDFPSGSTIRYEILKPDRQVWESNTSVGITTVETIEIPKDTLFSHEDTGWHFLQVRDAGGNDIDPALSDPDFNQTWFSHTPPGFGTPPFSATPYDGPAFSPASTPIHYGAATDFPNAGLELSPPSGGQGHTLWLLKTIDGGFDGFDNLDLSVRIRDDSFIYLNGELVGRTFGAPAGDTWTSHGQSRGQAHSQNISFLIGRHPILNPGPNLLAISVHSSETNLSSLGFSAELKGSKKTLPEIRDVQENISGNRFSLSYLTGSPQPTLINFGTNRTNPETHQIPGDRIFHQFETTDLKESTTYFYAVLRDDGSPFAPPVTGHFTTPDSTFIEKSSSDWQVLHSLDDENLGIDPSLTDPDFNTTWMTLGMPESAYDGPAFIPGQTTPFHVSGADAGTNGTVLTNPGENRSGAVYLVKEITGPSNGAQSLDFDISSFRAYRLYLNGKLLIDSLGIKRTGSNWDHYWEDQLREISRKPGFLLPGKNVLAISLHPYNQNNASLDFDMALTGVTGLSEMIPLPDPVHSDSFTTIQWFTASPSGSSLRYGPARNDLPNSINLPDSNQVHQVQIPNPPAGQRLYYEILKPNGDSYEPPSINSFIVPKKTILPFESTWAYLNPRHSETNNSIDPATLDPDFYQTWSTQSIGSFPGNAPYDGPVFSSPSSAPFGPESSNSTTTITQPGAVWFLKEVDGGATGFHQLELTSNGDTSVTVFLNGNKIGETYTPVSSQAIWAQSKGFYYRGSEIPIPSNLILPPGPNLIAVQMHISHSSDNDVFDLRLLGTPLEQTNSVPAAINSTSTSVDLNWATAESQSTRVRWGKSPMDLDQEIQIPGNRRYHTLSLPSLEPSTTYFLEALDPSGGSVSPPLLASFRTLDPILLGRRSSGWLVLESITAGTFVDPVTTDSDFLSTWYDPTSYNGPAFTPLKPSPFVSQGPHLRVGETLFQTIDSKVRPVWLLKEIDGGDTGYHSLSLDGIIYGGFFAYLNGQPLISLAMTTNPAPGSWNHFANSSSADTGNFLKKLPREISLNPGPNLLAISLHPYHFNNNGYLGGEFELRGIPRRFSNGAPTYQFLDFTTLNISWTTSQPARTRVRFGSDQSSLDQVIEDSELKTNHRISFPEFIEGGNYSYEFLATDALGNKDVTVGSFQIYPQIMRRPFLQKSAPNSMTVKWRTRDPGETLLRFGQDPANLDQVISGTSAPAPLIFFSRPDLNGIITDHTVTIAGLDPATKYYYQIASDHSSAPASDLHQFFTTPPLPGTPAKTRIWVVGDSGSPGQDVLDVKDAYLDYTADTPTDVWLMLGDNAYNSGTDSEYQNGLFNIFPELLKNTPVWPTMGNHDGYTKQYYGVFDLPTNGQSGGFASGTEKYYSFDHGNIHFICLNSEEDPAGMTDWLRNDLQSTRSDWIIAFFHHGPYTRGSHNSDFEREHFVSRESYLPILEDYGVDLILSGHSHQYERSHLLNGHYRDSAFYQVEDHALDPGPGSPLGVTDRDSGLFQYSSVHTSYRKGLASPNSGQVSATIGASSILGSWSVLSGQDRHAITHPDPHPVHIATIRVLGSMIIDIDDHTLRASYLDSNGQIRDHFEIQKSYEESPAITWWKNNFGEDSYPYFADWFADADGDSNNNLSEYVLGGEPLTSDQLSEATITVDGIYNGEPDQWFTIRYKLREGTEVIVESSINLIDFYQSGVETRRLSQPDAQGIARWESRVRRTNQRTLFFQLKVSR